MTVLLPIFIISLVIGVLSYSRTTRLQNTPSQQAAKRRFLQILVYGISGVLILSFGSVVTQAHPHWTALVVIFFAFVTAWFLGNILFPQFFGLQPRRPYGTIIRRTF